MRALVRRKVTVPDGAKLVAQRFYHSTETRWQIWHYTTIKSWRNLKLIAVTNRKRRKHSYWFGWDVDEQRFAASKQLDMLREWEPKIVVWAQRMCEEHLT